MSEAEKEPEDFRTAFLARIASACGVPYESVAADLSAAMTASELARPGFGKPPAAMHAALRTIFSEQDLSDLLTGLDRMRQIYLAANQADRAGRYATLYIKLTKLIHGPE